MGGRASKYLAVCLIDFDKFFFVFYLQSLKKLSVFSLKINFLFREAISHRCVLNICGPILLDVLRENYIGKYSNESFVPDITSFCMYESLFWGSLQWDAIKLMQTIEYRRKI